MTVHNGITVRDAAHELGISTQRVRFLISEGRLKATAIGEAPKGDAPNKRTYLIDPKDLDAVRDRPTGRPRKNVEINVDKLTLLRNT